MGQEPISDQQELKPKRGLLNTGAQLILPVPKAKNTRLNSWLLIAWLCSVLLHGLLIFLWAPKLEMLTDSAPKNKFEVELKFKPVVATTPTNNIKPEKADFFAEADQSAPYPQKAQSTSPKAGKSEEAPKAQKKAKLAHKPRSANDFLARPQAADPLGLRASPNSPNNSGALAEHLPEVAPGEQTKLNAWSWRHAPFFNRIKTQIGQVWAPNRQIARFDPQGVLLGQKDRVTVLSVTIDPEGKLKGLQIANSSGVVYLDEEAERAFRKAAPFPFPPKDLFNTPEGFTFQFAFHLQQNKGMKFDFDWHKGD